MERKQTSSAQLALAARKLNANKAPRVQAQAPRETEVPSSVNGGFRAGKRKRGNSLLKRNARDNAHAITHNVRDADGITVATLTTLKYKRAQ